MYYYGNFYVAFRGPAKQLRELSGKVGEWAESPNLANLSRGLYEIKYDLEGALQRGPASPEDETAVISCSMCGSATLILNTLNLLLHFWPQIEIAAAGRAENSITDGPAAEYAFYSPPGCDSLDSTYTKYKYEDYESDGLELEEEDTLEESHFEDDWLLDEPCEKNDWNFPPEADWIPFRS